MPSKNNLSKTKLADLNGKSAVFVRGFIEHLLVCMDEGVRPIYLRDCQDAGVDAVQELGDDISVSYLSQLSNKIELETRSYEKKLQGKKYTLVLRDTRKLQDLVNDENFGRDLKPKQSVSDVEARSAMIDHLVEYGGVRIYADRPVPKAPYALLREQFMKGELVMVFCSPKDLAFGDEYPEFTQASVSDQDDDDA